MFKQIALMFQFYTRIPIPIDLKATSEDYGKGMAFAPLVGAVLGALCALVYYAVSRLGGGFLPACFAVAAYAYFSGGLHLDGLGDTADGIFSNTSRERTLEIMKDSRVGTFGLLAVVLVLLLNIAIVSAMDEKTAMAALFVMPICGRFASCLGCRLGSYARENGMGKSFMAYTKTPQVVIALVLTILGVWFILYEKGIYSILLTAVVTALFVLYMKKKIGGMTGDTAGAVLELSQTAVLLLLLILAKIG